MVWPCKTSTTITTLFPTSPPSPTAGFADQTLDTIGGELGVPPAEAEIPLDPQTFQYDNLYRLTRAANWV